MEIIAHRGFWLEPEEKNTIPAFRRALCAGFGIETDIRDYDQNLVISHDIPSSKSVTLEEFLSLVFEINPSITLALNVKADGLNKHLLELDRLETIPHFYFDMSVPDMLGYVKNKQTLYSRYSDIEEYPALYSESNGIWLDNFTSSELRTDKLVQFIKDDKSVALVSPELHGFEYENYWCSIKQLINENPDISSKIKLCTDYPDKAKRYFCES